MDDDRFPAVALDAALAALDALAQGAKFSQEDLLAAAYALDLIARESVELRRMAQDSDFAASAAGIDAAGRVRRLIGSLRADASRRSAAGPTLH